MSKSYVIEPNLLRLRALKMLEMKFKGKSNVEIAKEFGVSAPTVVRALSLAARGDLAAQFEDQILSELTPLAITAFKTALTNGDAQVALEVLKGTNLLKKQSDKRPSGGDADGGDELEIYIRAKRSGPTHRGTGHPATTAPGLPPLAPSEAPIVDAEILEAPASEVAHPPGVSHLHP